MRRPQTIDGWLLAGCGLAGAGVAVALLRGASGLPAVLLVLGLCLAWAFGLASGLVALRWLVERARGRQRPPTPRLARRALAGAGAGLVLGMAPLFADGWAVSPAVAVGAGLALLAAAWWTPRVRGPHRVLMLAGCALAVDGLREAEVFQLHLTQDRSRLAVQTSGGLNCTGVDWPEGRGITQLRPGYTVVDGGLTGGVGARLAARFGQAAVASNDFLVGQLSGHVDAAGPGCYLPGARSLSWQGLVSLDVSYLTQWGRRQLSCGGAVTFSVDLELQALGVGSCARLQAQAAQLIGDRVVQHLRGLSGR